MSAAVRLDVARCAFCNKPVGRGKAFCRKHWMALAHFWRVQIGNAMTDEKDAGTGPDDNGQYHGAEYREVVQGAVESLQAKDEETAGAL